jgi:hypothetical protein
MKRIFTLLVSLGLIAAVQAQPGNRDRRDFDDDNDISKVIIRDNDDFGKNTRYDDRVSPNRRLAFEIAKINREYDYRIQMVRSNYFMSRFAKMRRIDQLEEQRQWEIRRAVKKFRERKYYDRDFDGRGHY